MPSTMTKSTQPHTVQLDKDHSRQSGLVLGQHPLLLPELRLAKTTARTTQIRISCDSTIALTA
jgi:hypothetical protein